MDWWFFFKMPPETTATKSTPQFGSMKSFISFCFMKTSVTVDLQWMLAWRKNSWGTFWRKSGFPFSVQVQLKYLHLTHQRNIGDSPGTKSRYWVMSCGFSLPALTSCSYSSLMFGWCSSASLKISSRRAGNVIFRRSNSKSVVSNASRVGSSSGQCSLSRYGCIIASSTLRRLSGSHRIIFRRISCAGSGIMWKVSAKFLEALVGKDLMNFRHFSLGIFINSFESGDPNKSMIISSWFWVLRPGNKGFRVCISAKMQPMDQLSMAQE